MIRLAAWLGRLLLRREIPDVPDDWRATRGKGTRILVIDWLFATAKKGGAQ